MSVINQEHVTREFPPRRNSSRCFSNTEFPYHEGSCGTNPAAVPSGLMALAPYPPRLKPWASCNCPSGTVGIDAWPRNITDPAKTHGCPRCKKMLGRKLWHRFPSSRKGQMTLAQGFNLGFISPRHKSRRDGWNRGPIVGLPHRLNVRYQPGTTHRRVPSEEELLKHRIPYNEGSVGLNPSAVPSGLMPFAPHSQG